jgi:hypothetical protein
MKAFDRWLISEETSRPFSHCIHCRLSLCEIAAPWLITKEYHRGECVLEYAICLPCREAVTATFDEESKAAVRGFLEREIDWQARLSEFMLMHDPCERFTACVACGESRENLAGYGISALFDADGQWVCGPLPLLICKSCTTQMTEALTPRSRALWQSFIGEHFAGPAGDSSLPGLL